MYGNIANSKQIYDLVNSGLIKMTPFDGKKLQTLYYPLNIKLIFEYVGEDELDNPTQISKKKAYILKANDYVVVEIDEKIVLSPGIIGEFVHSSNLIEKGLSLTCGKLDPNYGKNGETIRFGLKNLRNVDVSIEHDLKLAYIRFYDLRGLDNLEYHISPEDLKLWIKRRTRDADDGPRYEDE